MLKAWNSLILPALLTASLLAIFPTSAVAQSRINDKDLENLMRNLRDDAKSFRPKFESDLKKSTIRKTSREKEARNLATRLEKQSEAMLKHFKDTKKADGELATVRSTAQQIEAIARQISLSSETMSRWSKIQTELQEISGAFGVQSSSVFTDNPRGISPYRQSSNSSPCGTAVGMERARTLVRECLAVSPATHPPCNIENSCSLIVDEIKRGCAMLNHGAPSFCNEYR